MFDIASREKFRFDSGRGLLTVEDLWDLPLQSAKNPNLDDIARGLFRKLKSGDDVSFVSEEKKSNRVDQLKFDIVKHIIDVKVAENKAAAEARANKERKARLLEILADKQDESLRNMTVDQLRAEIDKM